MHLIKLFILIICVSSLALGQSVNLEETTKSGDRLIIKIRYLKGEINIEGWDKQAVQISGRVDVDGDKPIHLRPIDGGFRLQIKSSDGYYDDDRIDGRLTIKVPKKYSVYLQTQTELFMSDVEGEFEISVANESAELNKLKGKGDISVVNGTLDISNSYLDGSVSNVNGDLTVKNTDLIGSVSTTNAKMRLSRAPEGLDIRCTNGDISIESAGKFIDARTTNANLKIDELNGRLEFESTNGSVSAKMIGDSKVGNHSVDIKTLNGSVDLDLPANFSADFDIEIREENNRRNRRRKPYTVKSDFKELKIKSEDFGDGDYEVTGVGKIGNGKNKARMKIVNGDVRITKY